jgi:hypothetical protein
MCGRRCASSNRICKLLSTRCLCNSLFCAKYEFASSVQSETLACRKWSFCSFINTALNVQRCGPCNIQVTLAELCVIKLVYCLDLDCIHTTFKVCTLFTFCFQCCNKYWEIGDLFTYLYICIQYTVIQSDPICCSVKEKMNVMYVCMCVYLCAFCVIQSKSQ